jgi:hypothetical protein
MELSIAASQLADAQCPLLGFTPEQSCVSEPGSCISAWIPELHGLTAPEQSCVSEIEPGCIPWIPEFFVNLVIASYVFFGCTVMKTNSVGFC